ncbi:hypothetical protein [Chitinophaga sp. YIM B06452]|uniref:hypothetical protein n=1 Tax=Chitinophaga sp. YIM B06452 TaxID=3082158 RepID=UPI0031FF1544
MGWIKEANKLGKYINTWKGFRFYCTVEPTSTESIIERDGEQWLRTEFTEGEYVAIDKTGMEFRGKDKVAMCFKIDFELSRRYFEKKEGVPIVIGPCDKNSHQ